MQGSGGTLYGFVSSGVFLDGQKEIYFYFKKVNSARVIMKILSTLTIYKDVSIGAAHATKIHFVYFIDYDGLSTCS